jgi:two-component system, chemotaxis family, chemotaxis protein CheY
MATGATILVVDDSVTVRQQLRGCLEGAGYSVVEADNGQAAIDLARTRQVQLVIIDVLMPVMNGISAIEGLRKVPGYAQTPIFVLTTESSGSAAKAGKAAGATAWIVKPFKSDALLKGVTRVLAPKAR